MKRRPCGILLLLGMVFVVDDGCSSRPVNVPLQDGAAGRDLPLGSGGGPGGTGGRISIGSGGTGATTGPVAEAGGSVADVPPVPLGAGGTADANLDVAASPGTDGGTDSSTDGIPCNYQCRTDSSGTVGWYQGDKLVCAASCLDCIATCSFVGTWSEGCYALSPSGGNCEGCRAASGGLIEWAICGGPYATAYLVWTASAGKSGYGPAVAVSGKDGWIKIWSNTAPFSPDSLPANPTSTSMLGSNQIEDLFSRVAAVDMTALPHGPSSGADCFPRLYVRLCASCVATTLGYGTPESVTPEMDLVWSWFDSIPGIDGRTHPRDYCSFGSGADR